MKIREYLINNLLAVLLLVLLPHIVVYFFDRSDFYFGRVDFFRIVLNYATAILVFVGSLYLLIFNSKVLKKGLVPQKTLPIIFLASGLILIVYSILVLYVLLATKNGIGF